MAGVNLLIAVMTYDRRILSECSASLSRLERTLYKAKVEFDRLEIAASPVSHARNLVGSYVLSSTFTHVLMVDHDTGFQDVVVSRQFHANKPVVGAVMPQRGIDIVKALTLAKTMSAKKAMARAMKFNFSGAVNKAAITEIGAHPVEAVGCGLMLVQRGVFEKLATNPDLRRHVDHKVDRDLLSGPLYGFFDQIALPSGEELPEDWSICARWRQQGGEVIGLFDQPVWHVGEFHYSANFSDTLD